MKCRISLLLSAWVAAAACAGSEADFGASNERTETGSGEEDAGAAQDDRSRAESEPERVPDAGGGDAPRTLSCTVLRRELLGSVDRVSDGEVLVIEQSGDETLLFVNAAAGGFTQASSNPYVYVDLSGASGVAVTDVEAETSTAWDLSLKRFVIRTNSGDSGPGRGGAQAVTGKSFEDVSLGDVDEAQMFTDDFLDDATCANPFDASEEPVLVTAMSGWFAYEEMLVTPLDIVFIVRAADGGGHFKLAVESYMVTPDGSEGRASGLFAIRYAPL